MLASSARAQVIAAAVASLVAAGTAGVAVAGTSGPTPTTSPSTPALDADPRPTSRVSPAEPPSIPYEEYRQMTREQKLAAACEGIPLGKCGASFSRKSNPDSRAVERFERRGTPGRVSEPDDSRPVSDPSGEHDPDDPRVPGPE